MGKIKIKHREPKRTEFTPNDIVIDVKNGRLFYKSNFDTFKVVGINLTNAQTSSGTAGITEEQLEQINAAIVDGDNELAASLNSQAITNQQQAASISTLQGQVSDSLNLSDAGVNEVLFNNGGDIDGDPSFKFLPDSGILQLPITNINNTLTTLGLLTIKNPFDSSNIPQAGGGVNLTYNDVNNVGNLAISTDHGTVMMGMGNSNFFHFQGATGQTGNSTSPKFYFDNQIVVNSGKIRSYDEDLELKAHNSDSSTNGHINKTKVILKNDNTDPLVEVFGDLIAKAQGDSLGKLSAENDIIAFASDKRLKENIIEIPNPLDKIKQLRGVYYDWKKNVEEKGFHPGRKTNEIGMVAQEVEKVIPQAIEPAPFNNDYKTIKYDRIIPLLVECIKDQQKQIDELKSIVNGI
jgi:hypothetical protein